MTSDPETRASTLCHLLEHYISPRADIPNDPDIVQALKLCTQDYDADQELRGPSLALLAAGYALLMDNEKTIIYTDDLLSGNDGNCQGINSLVHVLYDRGEERLAQYLAKWVCAARPKTWFWRRRNPNLLAAAGLISSFSLSEKFFYAVSPASPKLFFYLWMLWMFPERFEIPRVDHLGTPPVDGSVVCDQCGIESDGCIKLSCGHLYHRRCVTEQVLRTWRCPKGCNIRGHPPITIEGGRCEGEEVLGEEVLGQASPPAYQASLGDEVLGQAPPPAYQVS
ncbi:hypothetical protein F4678DRAFT_455613 [Xylaria arbuscula]|nr:hypothetical protein F4678DRAFT_455613 [Xylaria arbuscula]